MTLPRSSVVPLMRHLSGEPAVARFVVMELDSCFLQSRPTVIFLHFRYVTQNTSTHCLSDASMSCPVGRIYETPRATGQFWFIWSALGSSGPDLDRSNFAIWADCPLRKAFACCVLRVRWIVENCFKLPEYTEFFPQSLNEK